MEALERVALCMLTRQCAMKVLENLSSGNIRMGSHGFGSDDFDQLGIKDELKPLRNPRFWFIPNKEGFIWQPSKYMEYFAVSFLMDPNRRYKWLPFLLGNNAEPQVANVLLLLNKACGGSFFERENDNLFWDEEEVGSFSNLMERSYGIDENAVQEWIWDLVNSENNEATAKDGRLLSIIADRTKTIPPVTNTVPFIGLKTLRLKDGKFSSLPDWIKALTNLQVLDVRWNQLTELPDLSTLSNLRMVDVLDNPLNEESIEMLNRLGGVAVVR